MNEQITLRDADWIKYETFVLDRQIWEIIKYDLICWKLCILCSNASWASYSRAESGNICSVKYLNFETDIFSCFPIEFVKRSKMTFVLAVKLHNISPFFLLIKLTLHKRGHTSNIVDCLWKLVISTEQENGNIRSAANWLSIWKA